MNAKFCLYCSQIGALNDYEDVHHNAMQLWEVALPNGNYVALTDTFTSQAFFKASLSLVMKSFLALTNSGRTGLYQ